MNHQTDQAENGVMTLPQCANADGQLPSCAPLANPYVPFQQTGADLYTASCALIRGTLFPGLDLPYGGQENTQEKLATASVEHLMMSEKQALPKAFAAEALSLDRESVGDLFDILVKRVVSHALVFRSDFENALTQQLQDKFFPNKDTQKKIRIQRIQNKRIETE